MIGVISKVFNIAGDNIEINFHSGYFIDRIGLFLEGFVGKSESSDGIQVCDYRGDLNVMKLMYIG